MLSCLLLLKDRQPNLHFMKYLTVFDFCPNHNIRTVKLYFKLMCSACVTIQIYTSELNNTFIQ